MAKQKMRETVLEQSKQENRNEEENCRRTGGFFDPIYHNTGSFRACAGGGWRIREKTKKGKVKESKAKENQVEEIKSCCKRGI